MNKRIELLLVKAIQESNSAVKNETYEKFAELIIQDCIKQCDKHDPHPDQWSEQAEFTERRTVRNCIKSIKEHFGVDP